MEAVRPETVTRLDEASVPVEVRLTARRCRLDPRTTAIRGDIVDIGLAGQISASRYTRPVTMACGMPWVPLRVAPGEVAIAVSELLYGETFSVFDEADGWCWGRTDHDRYLGWVPAASLVAHAGDRDLAIGCRFAPVFADTDIKSPVIATLPFGARLADSDGPLFIATGVGGGPGYVHRRHVRHRHVRDAGPAADGVLAIARLFTGAPYVWGGRRPDGVDCSGLVQTALNAGGTACPRDSDQQVATVGSPIAFEAREAGDLVFFPGHVGLLASRDRLFHANAHWMRTLEEPLADVVARLHGAGVAEPIIGVRRPHRV